MRILLVLAAAMLLSGCGYNTIQQKDEAVSAAWSQVLNVYKRRADLVPNLVATVQGYASHEQRVLTEVTEARSRVGSINVDAGDAASLEQFQQAQGQLQSAIGRLLMVSENYPQLKADQNFLQLQAQLEGTENRITVERQRYIESVQDYNTFIRQFPTNLTAMVFGYDTKPNFSVDNEAQIRQPPTVDFSQPGATPATAPTPSEPVQPEPAQPEPAPANG
ncbi:MULTISPECIES: LemA family protein [unclassified Lysobacter]